MFDKSSLFSAASIIGKPIKIDVATVDGSRLFMAHICVEIDLLKPKVEDFCIGIRAEKRLQRVVYEKHLVYCVQCSHLGHSEEDCYAFGKLNSDNPIEPGDEVTQRSEQQVWIQKKGISIGQANAKKKDRVAGNNFHLLSTLEEEEQRDIEGFVGEAAKVMGPGNVASEEIRNEQIVVGVLSSQNLEEESPGADDFNGYPIADSELNVVDNHNNLEAIASRKDKGKSVEMFGSKQNVQFMNQDVQVPILGVHVLGQNVQVSKPSVQFANLNLQSSASSSQQNVPAKGSSTLFGLPVGSSEIQGASRPANTAIYREGLPPAVTVSDMQQSHVVVPETTVTVTRLGDRLATCNLNQIHLDSGQRCNPTSPIIEDVSEGTEVSKTFVGKVEFDEDDSVQLQRTSSLPLGPMVYAKCSRSERISLWESLLELKPAVDDFWMIGGDFNIITGPNEHSVGTLSNQGVVVDFNNFLMLAGLLDAGYVGDKFTWTNNRVWKRLDRKLHFKLKRLKAHLKWWNSELFGNTFENVRKAEEEFDSAEKEFDLSPTVENKLHMAKCQAALFRMLDMEEMLWKRKAAVRWIGEGERNTKFFHNLVQKRRMANRGVCVEESELI
ncbi:hypothetical protein ZIOFF_062607 [Zingiber officinale]|uniref:Uncharacterized protein n=1 Tax=Zingiber officinale TaxID=94328 RepID=A0A8J5F515_ZINOF|nr:hypothetical protein ZIOFF_062607 [Zingiber officinale]